MAAKSSALGLLVDGPPARPAGTALIDSFPAEVREMIVAARRHGHPYQQIAAALTADGYPVGRSAVSDWLRRQDIG